MKLLYQTNENEEVENSQGAAPAAATSTPTQPDTQVHIAAFFVEYTGFQYNPAQPSVNQFRRLWKTRGWNKNSREYIRARQGFYLALVLQFNATYGTDQNDLAAWQNLCRAFKVEDVPEELSKCRKVISAAAWCTIWIC